MTENRDDKKNPMSRDGDMSESLTEVSIKHMVTDINFPISKGDLIQHNKERKGKVSNVNAVVSIIDQIQNRVYNSSKDLEIEIDRVNI